MMQVLMIIIGCLLWAAKSEGVTFSKMEVNGQVVKVQGNNWGLSIYDEADRPLVMTGSVDNRYWSYNQDGVWAPVNGDINHLQYAVLDANGRLVSSGINFPSNTPPNTAGLAHEVWANDRTAFNQNSVGPRLIDQDAVVAAVPIQFYYAGLDGDIIWEDDYYHPSASITIGQEVLYNSIFAPTMPAGVLSPGLGLPIEHSLPEIWVANQDTVVSRIIPDTRRCAWYGDQPGWACAPDGQPWRINIRDFGDQDALYGELYEQGLDLYGAEPFDQVIFLLSGTHQLPELLARPAAGYGQINIVTNNFFFAEPPMEQMPPAWVEHIMLQNLGLPETFIWGGTGDTGCWDAMGMGFTGYADNSDLLFNDPNRGSIFDPAILNPLSRKTVGWARRAIRLSGVGDHQLQPNQVYYLENPNNDEELFAFYTCDRSPGAVMSEFPLSLEAFGGGLAFSSQAEHVTYGGLEQVPTLVRSESVIAEGTWYNWDERYAQFPSQNNSTFNGTWQSPETFFSYNITFDVDWSNVSTVMHLSNAPADHVILVTQDGQWQTEVPLASVGPLSFPLNNLGAETSLIHLAVFDDVHENWVNCNSQLSGNWGQNQMIPFYIMPGQLSLPSDQNSLGKIWDLRAIAQSLVPLEGFHELSVNKPIIGLRQGDSLAASAQSLSASDHEWSVIAEGGQLQVSRNLDQVRSITVSGNVLHMFFDNFIGAASSLPELIVLTDQRLQVFSLGRFQTHGLDMATGWPVTAQELSSCAMVVNEAELDENPVIIYAENGYIRIRTNNGELLPDRVNIQIPADCWPVTKMAWMGGDALGPKIALAGGRYGEHKLLIMDLSGSMMFYISGLAYEGERVNFDQLLVGDFLNNGYYDLLAVVTEGGWIQSSTMVAWSEVEQQWVYNTDILSHGNSLGTGVESMVPIPGASPLEATKVAFNFWYSHMTADPDSSHLYIVDFSVPDWQHNFQHIVVPEIERRYLAVGDLDNDGQSDLLGTARGVGVEMWRGDGTSFHPWSDGQLVHYSISDEQPVPVMVNGELQIGLCSAGYLRFSHTESSNWLTWPNPLGPGNTCQEKHLTLPAPSLSITVTSGRPTLTVDLHGSCNGARIYRSANQDGPFTLVAAVSSYGANPVQWQDQPSNQLPNPCFYRATAIRSYNGPDGNTIR